MTLITFNGLTPADKSMSFYKERFIAIDWQPLVNESGKAKVTIYLEDTVRLHTALDGDELDHLLQVLVGVGR